jgi:hypothetical protein
MATFPRVPLYDRSRPVPADYSLFSWSNANPKLYTNPIPKRDYDFPLPPPIPRQLEYSATSGNPSLYKAPALPKQRAPLFDRNPITYTIFGDYSWAGNNVISLSFAPPPPPPSRPAMQPIDWSIPAPPRLDYNWIPWNLALPATGQWVPFFQYDFPLPPPVPRLQDPSWFVTGNPGLYTNPRPINQYDWSLPQPRVYPVQVGLWIHANPNIYTNPIPHNQYHWPLLVESPRADVRSFIGTATLLTTPGPPAPGPSTGDTDRDKIRIGIDRAAYLQDGNPTIGGVL